VLGVKENQRVLYEEIREYFAYLDDRQTKELPEDEWESGVEQGHGRIEQRRIRTVTDIGFLGGKQDWKDLTTGIEVRGRRRAGDETSGTGWYFISNKDISAEAFGKDIRGQHWGTACTGCLMGTSGKTDAGSGKTISRKT
jgi:hypothetical protein